MKNKSIIIILTFVLFIWWIFWYVSYQNILKKEADIVAKNKIEQEKRDKEIDKEIEKNLKTLEVKPVLEWTNTDTQDIQNNTDKKSNQDIIKQEKLDILTFTKASECESLKFLKQKCKDQFVFSLAKANNDISYCDRLKTKEEQINCKDEISYNNNNCSWIQNSYLKSKCEYNNKVVEKDLKEEQILAGNITSADTCKTFTSYTEKEACIKKVALSSQNINVCSTFFTNKDEQSKCLKNIAYDFNRDLISKAFETKNLSLCDKVTDATIKAQCKTMKF